MKYIIKLLYALFPMFNCNYTNSIVRRKQTNLWEKLERGEPVPDIQLFGLMEIGDSEHLIKGVRDNITSLQDKAKVTAVAVTLAFSMVGGISSYLLNLKEKLYINGFLTGILVFFVVASCFYLITSGYYSLLTLNSRPKYDFSPETYSYLYQLKSDNQRRIEKRYILGEQYNMNVFTNIILNNYVDCSNNNLRNALISLGIFFSLICFSFGLADNQTQKQKDQQNKMLSEQIQLLEGIQNEIKELNYEVNELKSENENDKLQLETSINNINLKLESLIMKIPNK